MLPLSRAPLLLRISWAPCITTIRGRKSRFDLPAKSKAARIKYPPMVCIEELLNVRNRYQEYRTILGAMRYTYCKLFYL
ncbi:hypothetical protein GDO78_016288 [Eleutherodactylus coqui]|uniref:Small ribosomal subunit protein mS26 n=1 Tax=Eleutherodactylus coqui TaxID=57060 RepID=A0A8J6BDK7_ELECQ|nr:hypothetical protein GDO78_016288 [Eleutherodactylus coqui]